ncbi:MAG: excinuclease ABC subunit UvrC [Candidatus Eisenbacteria sp.]|nr:excinuclease ABC subunit UvrC [Candidatus Eisenbacteria bacterium]
MTDRTSVARKLGRVPQKPGAYLMRDDGGAVIYVGKAKRLRSRLRSYFGRGQTDPKGAALRERISDFEYIVTDSEVEALILELHLIKEHRPRYNVNLRDDKKYPYIKVTLQDAFPRVSSTRRLAKDGSRYFGPYTDAGAMRRMLQTLRHVFPMRTCRFDLPGHAPGRPCLNYEIKQCVGPCRGDVDQEEYRRMIRNLCSFLSGNREVIFADLETQMKTARSKLDFERAARIRDQLRALRKVSERQKVFSPDARDRDVVAVSVMDTRAVGLILRIRDGKLLSRESYPLSVSSGTPSSEVITTFLKLHYGSATEIPAEILVPESPEDSAAIGEWLEQKRGRRVSVVRPQRGRKRGLVGLAVRNADLLLVEYVAASAQGLDTGIEALGEALRLDTAPVRIEGFDVSNLGGRETVASLVVFENGKPLRRCYRNFRVRSARAGDDFAAMEEVVGRRYGRVVDERGVLPNLILVDGGKGQISAAGKALRRLKLSIPVIGLAKREERVFQMGRSAAVEMTDSSPAKRLLERIRDEAHRVAIAHHRRRRQKALHASNLDDIPGIGADRRRRLIRHFGSLRSLAGAGRRQIQSVPGIGPEMARRVYGHLHGEGTK